MSFFNLYRHNFVRVAVGIPEVRVADPRSNAGQTIALLRRAAAAIPSLGRVSALFDETRFATRHGDWLRRAGLEPDLRGTLVAMVEDYRRRGLL